MKKLEFAIAFLFVGIIPPVLLMKIVTPWPLTSILLCWIPVALLALPLGVMFLKKKRVL